MNLIHYSEIPIPKLEMREYNAIEAEVFFRAKPYGFWVSVEGFEDDQNWKSWCIAERFRLENLTYKYEVILKDNANILHLKTSHEILDFTEKYVSKCPDRFWDVRFDTYAIEWGEVKKLYQGIIIAPYQWDCRLSFECDWYYGWDCSSGCIWDLTCVKDLFLLDSTPVIKEEFVCEAQN